MIYFYSFFTFTIVVLMLWFMLKRNVVLVADIPNHRSMHRTEVPRGGGVAIVLGSLAGGLLYLTRIEMPGDQGYYLLVAILLMAMLGLLDDYYEIGVIGRLLVQCLVAAGAWYLVIDVDSGTTLSAWYALPGIFVIVWATNLTNFMDGMDGLVATHSIIGLLTLALWLMGSDGETPSMLCVIIAAAVAGFLVFNWHPAKVFMGDTGSLTLGMVLAVISLLSISRYDIPVAGCVILFSPFLIDSGVTLLRRILMREKWWQAHRSHFYQRAVAAGGSQLLVLKNSLTLQVLVTLLATGIVTQTVPAWFSLGAAVIANIYYLWNILMLERTRHHQADT